MKTKIAFKKCLPLLSSRPNAMLLRFLYGMLLTGLKISRCSIIIIRVGADKPKWLIHFTCYKIRGQGSNPAITRISKKLFYLGSHILKYTKLNHSLKH